MEVENMKIEEINKMLAQRRGISEEAAARITLEEFPTEEEQRMLEELVTADRGLSHVLKKYSSKYPDTIFDFLIQHVIDVYSPLPRWAKVEVWRELLEKQSK